MPARTKNLLQAAAENLTRNLATYAAAAAGLVLGLSLLLSAVAVGEGLKAEALAAVDAGADVYCTWDVFGRDHPLPAERLAEMRELEGVVRVVPRVLGRVALGERYTLVVGVPLAELAAAAAAGTPPAIEGDLPSGPSEILVGRELARALGLGVGSTVALEGRAIRLFRVAGVTDATASLWSAKAVVCDLAEAQIVFGETTQVSDACIYTRAGYEDLVAEALERLDPRFRVQTRDLVHAYVVRGMTLRGGVFTALFALALALAVPAFAITTYLGHTPRRREIGLLKAEGWRTAEVLEMVALENLILSLAAAGTATLLALVWVGVLRAPLIASFLLPDLPLFPEVRIPARFLPLPPLLALLFSLTVTMTGSIYATWRTAITRPIEVLR